MLRLRGNWRTPWRKPWGYPLQDWTPAQLFASGDKGFYDDPTTGGLYVFSDTAGTTHAPLAGTVARLDAPPGSPVAASFTNATVSQQPIRRVDGLEFDGVDDYLSYPDDPALRFGTTDFTVAVAFNPDLDTGQIPVFGKRGFGGSGSNPGWGIRQSGLGVVLEYDYPGNVDFPAVAVTGNGALSVGTWADLIVERRYTSGQATGYLDNVEQLTASVGVADISGTKEVAIGAGGNLLGAYDGTIGRTFAIDRLLTPVERAKLNVWLKEPHS